MVDQISIERATEKDIPEILDLLKAALGETHVQRRTPELFRWKHQQNPFGRSIILVARISDRIAGVRALLRWELQARSGNAVRCARPVDTATHPAHIRKGIFRSLTMTAIEIARDEGIELLFNTPNMKSAPGYLTMGWSEVGWIGVMARPLLGRTVRSAGEVNQELEMVIPGASVFNVVNIEDRPPLGLRTQRTATYQRWRFASHPYATYGWVGDRNGYGGAVVRPSVRFGRSETLISDFIGTATTMPFRKVIRLSRSRYVAAWFSARSPERSKAARAGMMSVPRMKTLRLVAHPLAELDTDPTDLASWDLAVGDLELL